MRQEDLTNHPIHTHLQINSLLDSLIKDLRLHTIRDLLDLDLGSLTNRMGVGPRRLGLLAELKRSAENLVNGTATIQVPIEQAVITETSGLARPIPFVPSFLKKVFNLSSTETIETLCRLTPAQLSTSPGWGEKKLKMTVALQKLYRNLDLHSNYTNSTLLGDIVPVEILPSEATAMLTLNEFLQGKGDVGLVGTALTDNQALRQTLVLHFSSDANLSSLRNQNWQDIPLRLTNKTTDFLNRYGVETVAELYDLISRRKMFYKQESRWVGPEECPELTDTRIAEVRQELARLASSGLDIYRFGKDGSPDTLDDLVSRVREALDDRQFSIIQLRSEGKTLEEVAHIHSITRERVRQIESKGKDRISSLSMHALSILEAVSTDVVTSVFIDVEAIERALPSESRWKTNLLLSLCGIEANFIKDSLLCRIPISHLKSLRVILSERIELYGSYGFRKFTSIKQLTDELVKKEPSLRSRVSFLDQYADLAWKSNEFALLIGEAGIRALLRGQLVRSGSNGLSFDEIDSMGAFDNADQLEEFLGEEAIRIKGDIFRRPGEVYETIDEVLEVLKLARTPIDVPTIMARCKRRLYQASLTSRYLSRVYEVISVGRGLYTHIDLLGITVRNVREIGEWGASLLEGEKRTIDGTELFDLYRSSSLPQVLHNPHQLVSILAKHPKVRRVSNNLEVAHQDSFEESELFLEKAAPEFAAMWHPTKNGAVTPADVRPNSFKVFWWKCEKGHEFRSAPVNLTRMSRVCPGCQKRWSAEKIRQFVASLREHLHQFTPAELYVIFQQSGLLDHDGRAKNFVRALVSGRLPPDELDDFLDGDNDVFDRIVETTTRETLPPRDDESDTDDSDEQSPLELDDEVELDNEPELAVIDEPDERSPDQDGVGSTDLPHANARDALKALDCPVIASADAEAIEFLVASAKAKIWSHAFRDPNAARKDLEENGTSEYSKRVKDEFESEYSDATSLTIPEGYSFSIDGQIVLPNLMQRHVAAQVRSKFRCGNWSGTGAGKTLSAVLASRICDSKLTVVCCPNAVVGDRSAGWAGEILHIFPDSDVATRTWEPQWRAGSNHRYLVLNYERLQQPDSEIELNRFLEQNSVDFIVIDEVHFVKQRYSDQISQRKRLLQAMVSEAGKANPHLRVLGLSATPVINNLQEGRSLIEMITGVEHTDLALRETVPNCMRLHQHLARLGTRWVPDYKPALRIETPEIDCSHLVTRIRQLGKKPSPLAIESLLTEARLPAIVESLKRGGRTLVYTHYVDGILAMLYEAISRAGFRVGFYTGESKEGLEQFKRGSIDVLIGSSAVGTGVDGLQHVCDRLVINSLPWTSAEFEQLIGRVWRQGQASEKVDVIIPLTYAIVNGEHWSYCESKMDRIRYKRSIADAAVDGVVPDGNLRSPAQAQAHILAWLERLEAGDVLTISRKVISIPLMGGDSDTQKRLANFGDFSRMNARWNTSRSDTLSSRLREDPAEWEHYHSMYRQAREDWPVVPYKDFIAWCEKREGYKIADFGCGEALVARAIHSKHTVYSFDHIAIDDTVIEGDMKNTGLEAESVDVALFSLSLMGSNFTDYIREAHRILKIDGQLHIYEAESRFNDPKSFVADLERLGFRVFEPSHRGAFLHFEGIKTERIPDPNCELKF